MSKPTVASKSNRSPRDTPLPPPDLHTTPSLANERSPVPWSQFNMSITTPRPRPSLLTLPLNLRARFSPSLGPSKDRYAQLGGCLSQGAGAHPVGNTRLGGVVEAFTGRGQLALCWRAGSSAMCVVGSVWLAVREEGKDMYVFRNARRQDAQESRRRVFWLSTTGPCASAPRTAWRSPLGQSGCRLADAYAVTSALSCCILGRPE